MGCNDELPFFADRFKHGDAYLFIFRPGAAHQEDPMAPAESFDRRKGFDMLCDGGNPVEAGVAREGDVPEPCLFQDLSGCFILDKEAGDGTQLLFCPPAVPSEERVVRAEDSRDQVNRDPVLRKDVQVVEPVFVLDEDGHGRPDKLNEFSCISPGIGRKVKDEVGPGIVFPDLISRGGVKGEEDPVFRHPVAELLHQRSSLLILSQRGTMEPGDLPVRLFRLRKCLPDPFQKVSPPLHPQLCLGDKQCRKSYRQDIEADKDIVYEEEKPVHIL